jgi:hypothetical protein
MSYTTPLHTDLWGVLYDWQTIIAGFLAVIAAAIGAGAAYHVGNAQIAATKQKDQLQAKSLAVVILPEIVRLRAHLKGAIDIVHQELPKLKDTALETNVAYWINMGAIELPPVLSRSIDRLYLLDETGAILIGLYSVTMQYNSEVKRLCDKALKGTYSFNASETENDLDPHLLLIRTSIDDAEDKLRDHVR